MKILLSAYACEPAKGSEPGVGWHWAIELARAGHEVHVLTRSNNIAAIVRSQAEFADAQIYFHGYDLPRSVLRWKRGQRGVHLYYLLWQWGAYRRALGLSREIKFDVVQHITFGVYRHPSFMGFLNVPFIFGPVGGGESTPSGLMSSLPRRGRWIEALRNAANYVARYDPLVLATYRRAVLILCKTPETLAKIPARFHSKCLCALEVGTEQHRLARTPAVNPSSACFLYAGRLLYWKGVHLALHAMAEVLRTLPEATLTIVGEGTDGDWFNRVARELGIQERVIWMGGVPQEKLYGLYGKYTAFVFPSLHDSSGNVIMEAMSQGLPVVCLDLGGPAAILPADCGLKIAAGDRDSQTVISEMAQSMLRLAQDTPLREKLAANALAAARGTTWGAVVGGALGEVEQVLAVLKQSSSDLTLTL